MSDVGGSGKLAAESKPPIDWTDIFSRILSIIPEDVSRLQRQDANGKLVTSRSTPPSCDEGKGNSFSSDAVIANSGATDSLQSSADVKEELHEKSEAKDISMDRAGGAQNSLQGPMAKSETAESPRSAESHPPARDGSPPAGDQKVFADAGAPLTESAASSALLLLLGDIVKGGPPPDVSVTSILAVGLVDRLPVFWELGSNTSANRICMLDIRLLESKNRRLCVRSLSPRVSVNGKPVGDKWHPLHEGDALGFGHTDCVERESRIVYAICYQQNDPARRQEAIAVAFAKDVLAEYSIDLPSDAIEEAGVSAILCPSSTSGKLVDWPRRAKKARDELLAVGSVARAIVESGRRHFVECANDEARARGLSFGTQRTAALGRVGIAIAKYYVSSGFSMPPATYWAMEGILKCNEALQREQLHAGEMDLAAQKLRDFVVDAVGKEEEALDAATVDRIVQQLVEEFDEERVLDPDAEFGPLIARVWEEFGSMKVLSFFRHSNEWALYHLQVRSQITAYSKRPHFAKKLQDFIRSLKETRGNHLAIDIYNHALALALANGNAAAIEFVLFELGRRNEADLETLRAWLLQAYKHADWPSVVDGLKRLGVLQDGEPEDMSLSSILLDLAEHMRSVGMMPPLTAEQMLAAPSRSKSQLEDDFLSDVDNLSDRDDVASDEEAMSDGLLTNVTGMPSSFGAEEDVELDVEEDDVVLPLDDVEVEEEKDEDGPDLQPGRRSPRWRCSRLISDKIAKLVSEARDDFTKERSPERSPEEEEAAHKESWQRTRTEKRKEPEDDEEDEEDEEAELNIDLGAWHWLAALAGDLGSRAKKPNARQSFRRELAMALVIPDRVAVFRVHIQQGLVFDDCPMLVGFRAAADARRALHEPKVSHFRFERCSDMDSSEPSPLPLVPAKGQGKRRHSPPPVSWRGNSFVAERSRSHDVPPPRGNEPNVELDTSLSAKAGRRQEILTGHRGNQGGSSSSKARTLKTPIKLCEPWREPYAAVEECGICVIYKPAFWTATTSTTVEEELIQARQSRTPRLQGWLRTKLGHQYPFLRENPRAGLVHRLDVQTSGPILVGTEEKAFLEMRDNLRKHMWYKEYLALMHGAVPPKRCCGTLEYKLFTKQEKDRGMGWRTEVNAKKGEYAATRYEAVESYRCRAVERGHTQRFTLIRMQLITGRTHQIRVHLQEFARDLGLPVHGIVGDYKYLPQEQVRTDKRICARVFLHAHRLHFPLPVVQGKPKILLRVKCPLPQELQRTLGKLERDERLTEQFRERNKKESVLQPIDFACDSDVVTEMPKQMPSNGPPSSKRGRTGSKGRSKPAPNSGSRHGGPAHARNGRI